MSMEIKNEKTVKRMWREAAVQDDIAAKAAAQIEALTAAERTASEQVLKAEAALREAQNALIAIRTDLATCRADHADATTERDDLRTIVRAVCADMGWPLPGADDGGQERTPPDGTGRLVANGDRATKANPAVASNPRNEVRMVDGDAVRAAVGLPPERPADRMVEALTNPPAGPQLPNGVAPIDPRSAEVTRTDGASE
jgi:hypothetical protein